MRNHNKSWRYIEQELPWQRMGVKQVFYVITKVVLEMPMIFHHRHALVSPHIIFTGAAVRASQDLPLLVLQTILISSRSHMSTLVFMSKKSLSIRLQLKSPSHPPHSHFPNFRAESGPRCTWQCFPHRCERSATFGGSPLLPGKSKERAFLSSKGSSPLPLPNSGWIRATLFERQENEYS